MASATRSRWIAPVVLSLLSLALLTCAHHPGGKELGVCNTGIGSEDRNYPIVCVSNTMGTWLVNPDPVHAYDVKEDAERRPSAYPVVLKWVTRDGTGDLSISFDDPGCAEKVMCRNGHCVAQTVRLSAKESKRCKYTVTLNGAKLDPVIIIDPCCD